MANYTLLLFWLLWLGTLYATLWAYHEFIGGVFGRHAAPFTSYVVMWVVLLAVALAVLAGSIYLKNHGAPRLALGVIAAPLVIASPYLLFLAAAILSGSKTRWN